MRTSKIITLSISPNHLRSFPSTQTSANIEQARFPDPLDQLQWIIGTQGFNLIEKQRLEAVKTGVALLQKRHEEIVKDKEGKILAMEFQLMEATDEKRQHDEKIQRLEEENAQNAKAAELFDTATDIIINLRETIQGMEEKLAIQEKQLESAKGLVTHHKERALAKQRQDRRIAIKLLSSVMELDDDVALPGQQRPISARRSPAEVPSPRSKSTPTDLPPTPMSTPQNSMLPLVTESDGEEDRKIFPSPTSIATATESCPNQSGRTTQHIGSTEATLFVLEVSPYLGFQN
jgi:hypothetical protein